jgi:hypothetical protein
MVHTSAAVLACIALLGCRSDPDVCVGRTADVRCAAVDAAAGGCSPLEEIDAASTAARYPVGCMAILSGEGCSGATCRCIEGPDGGASWECAE